MIGRGAGGGGISEEDDIQHASQQFFALLRHPREVSRPAINRIWEFALEHNQYAKVLARVMDRALNSSSSLRCRLCMLLVCDKLIRTEQASPWHMEIVGILPRGFSKSFSMIEDDPDLQRDYLKVVQSWPGVFPQHVVKQICDLVRTDLKRRKQDLIYRGGSRPPPSVMAELRNIEQYFEMLDKVDVNLVHAATTVTAGFTSRSRTKRAFTEEAAKPPSKDAGEELEEFVPDDSDTKPPAETDAPDAAPSPLRPTPARAESPPPPPPVAPKESSTSSSNIATQMMKWIVQAQQAKASETSQTTNPPPVYTPPPAYAALPSVVTPAFGGQQNGLPPPPVSVMPPPPVQPVGVGPTGGAVFGLPGAVAHMQMQHLLAVPVTAVQHQVPGGMHVGVGGVVGGLQIPQRVEGVNERAQPPWKRSRVGGE